MAVRATLPPCRPGARHRLAARVWAASPRPAPQAL